MKKIILLALTICSLSFYSQAQDFIVTVKGDTFECKITKISDRFIHFDYEVNNEIRSTVILLDQVSSYDRGTVNVSKPAGNDNTNTPSNAQGQSNQQGNNNTYNDQYYKNIDKYKKSDSEKTIIYRLSAHGGYGYLTAKGASGLSPDLKAYEDELRSGSHFGASFHFFPEIDKAGYGLRLNSFNSSNSGTFSFFDTDANELVVFDIEDNINIIYVGPHITSRNKFGLNESALLFGFSLGYVSYVNNAYANESIRITGEGLGLMADLGIDIELAEGVLLNLEASYIVNSLTKVNVNGTIITFPDDERQSNSHVNIGAGISFVFN